MFGDQNSRFVLSQLEIFRGSLSHSPSGNGVDVCHVLTHALGSFTGHPGEPT